MGGGGVGFGSALDGICMVVEGLALEVRHLDDISVDQAKPSNSGAGQQFGYSRAKSADSDDGDSGVA